MKDIIVCGHSHCGAMKGLLEPKYVESLPAVASWLKHAEATRRIVLTNYKELEGAPLLAAAVEENVLVQLENLETLPSVASGLRRDDLHLHGWVYVIETGDVFAYDPDESQFVSLARYEYPVAELVRRRRTSETI